MAKMVASEYANEVVEDSFRIHGGYGYSKEYEIERLMREVKFMLIGEGTSDIQKMIIGRSLLKDYKLKGRSEEHTSELQSLMRISYAVFCLKKKTTTEKQ